MSSFFQWGKMKKKKEARGGRGGKVRGIGGGKTGWETNPMTK